MKVYILAIVGCGAVHSVYATREKAEEKEEANNRYSTTQLYIKEAEVIE